MARPSFADVRRDYVLFQQMKASQAREDILAAGKRAERDFDAMADLALSRAWRAGRDAEARSIAGQHVPDPFIPETGDE